MLHWLADNAWTAGFILGLVALVLGVGWWMTRKKALGIAVIVVVGLIGVVGLIAALVETDSKQIEASIHAMARGVKDRDLDQVFAHVSDSFRTRVPILGADVDKAAFRRFAQQSIQAHHVEDLIVWDIEALKISRPERTARVAFQFKFKLNEVEQPPMQAEAEFTLDPDNRWRLKSFEIRRPGG